MASSRPKSSVNMNQNRRMNPFPDLDRMRVFGPSSNIDLGYQSTPLPEHYLNPGIPNISNSQSIPPPLPPRPDVCRSRYSSYNNPYYSPFSRFSPSMYSSYGGYRTPYSRYGMRHSMDPSLSPDSHSSFIELAEESTRPAFESIESVVDIVGSISMMLESTYHAVYSSYNAILGVVDQFSRLKDHLAEVLSFLAVLRGLRYLCLKLLYLLKLRKDNPSVEAAWKTAKSVSEHSDFSQFHNDKKSPWPIFMFFGLVVGAPWLMFKLLSRSIAKKPFDLTSWKEKDRYLFCIGGYNFNTNKRGELSFKAGEYLYVAPKHLQANVPRGWILACNKNKQVGLIPENYIKNRVFAGQLKGSVSKNSPAEQQQIISEKPDFPQINPVNPCAPEDEPSTSNVESINPSVKEKRTENEE